MIVITGNTEYDNTKDFDSQSEEFKGYFMELYDAVPKIPYPDFNADGSITYNVDDVLFSATVTRVQQNPFSSENRAVKELIIEVNVI